MARTTTYPCVGTRVRRDCSCCKHGHPSHNCRPKRDGSAPETFTVIAVDDQYTNGIRIYWGRDDFEWCHISGVCTIPQRMHIEGNALILDP